jgi:hypothetical protein
MVCFDVYIVLVDVLETNLWQKNVHDNRYILNLHEILANDSRTKLSQENFIFC